MNDLQISIRSIQHYLYCPHRWGLLEIDQAWAENVYVTKANLLHDRVHDPANGYCSRGKKIFTSVQVYHDEAKYELYGILDCLEFCEEDAGDVVITDGRRGHLCIVEYKPTMPSNVLYNHDDLMQVVAQKICTDYVFGGDCDTKLYYADKKRRIDLPIREKLEEYTSELRKLLAEMRGFLRSGTVPPIRRKQYCSGCSMKDLCMPKISKSKKIKDQISQLRKGEACENF